MQVQHRGGPERRREVRLIHLPPACATGASPHLSAGSRSDVIPSLRRVRQGCRLNLAAPAARAPFILILSRGTKGPCSVILYDNWVLVPEVALISYVTHFTPVALITFNNLAVVFRLRQWTVIIHKKSPYTFRGRWSHVDQLISSTRCPLNANSFIFVSIVLEWLVI